MSSWIIGGTAIASILISAAGAGLSYYGQQQQSKNASSVANYNAQIQQQNADRQRQIAQIQAQNNAVDAQNYQAQAINAQRNAVYQQTSAAQNQQIALAQYKQAQNNATSLENNAKAQEAQGQERARRMRMDQERTLASRRANTGASGIVNEGSPLAVLADDARLTELNIQDAAHQTEMDRQGSLQKANLERFNGNFSLIDASMQGQQGELAKYQESLAKYQQGIGQYQESIAGFEGASSESARQIAYREADLTRMSGASQAQGYQLASYGSLISGAGQMANSASNFAYQSKPLFKSS